MIETSASTKKHTGSCHCGAVKYEVEADVTKATKCNCSVCTKLSTMGAIVKPAAFKQLAGEDAVSEYVWGGRVARRFFCKTCGTHCFSRGHLEVLGGDFVSVNVNTLDDVDPWQLTPMHWDGRHDNWMAGARSTPWPIAAPRG
jgi:hypothetical protein